MIHTSLLFFSPLLLLLTLFTSCSTLPPFANFRQKQKKDHFLILQQQNLQKLSLFRSSQNWKKNTFVDEDILKIIPSQSPPIIIISIDNQRGYLTAGPLVALDFPVATGRRSFPTPTGNFTIIEKKKTYSSNLYGKILDAEGKVINPDADLRTAIIPEGGQFVGSPMPFWMRLTNDGVGLHVGHIPGRPASHGCIRIPRTAAQKIFSIAPIGTPVQITQHWEPQGLITANRPNP